MTMDQYTIAVNKGKLIASFDALKHITWGKSNGITEETIDNVRSAIDLAIEELNLSLDIELES